MIRIGLLSDTHSFIHPKCFEFFKECSEIWHAGDIGDWETAAELSKFKPFRAVYGNIDSREIRSEYPKELIFFTEKMKIVMTHIGGYPGRYERNAAELIRKENPDVFICGHSHILKVIFDSKYRALVINPGAAGKYGFHLSMTMIRFVIENDQIKNLEVLDIPRK